MKLQYFKGERPNFGDELNPWLWPQLLPGFLDNDPRVLFIGIGSIIGSHYEADAKKVVFGAGYVQNYSPEAPNVHGGDWDIFFVRGPRTARRLGLPESIGIGDPAILLRALNVSFRRDAHYTGFIPHWQSLTRGNWRTVCELAGIRLIDPCASVERIIAEILGCEVLIAEAMHGAIVADALRVPWVPVLPIDPAHREKWFDWADALNLELKQHRLSPSSLAEVQLATTYQSFLSSLLPDSAWRKLLYHLARKSASSLTRPFITSAAAQHLSALAKEDPFLSADGIIETVIEKMLAKLSQLQNRYRQQVSRAK